MKHRYPPTFPQRQRQRGAGTLIVVMVLFFVMSLVAAYASRNMIFEQKTSANQYRSTQAFEVAQAGVEWALAMLNGGRVNDFCVPNAGGTSFRDRYLTISAAGVIQPGGAKPDHVMCVRTDTGWSCSCPAAGSPVLSVAAPGFRLLFLPAATADRPNLLKLRSIGCTNLAANCQGDGATATGSNAIAQVFAVVGLKGAISTPPAAALTAGGTVNVNGAGMTVVNTDPLANGTTIDARGLVTDVGLVLRTTPGAPSAGSFISNDSAVPATANLLFASVFGMKQATYREQPATIVLTCPADCGATAIQNLVLKNPGRTLWLEGDVDFNAAVDIGSPTSPVAIVVHGDLTASTTPVNIYGLVYNYNALGGWVPVGSPLIQGAAIAEGNLTGTGTPTIVYDRDILNRLRLASGSFVRVPGGWRDF